MKTVSSRDFNQDVSSAKRASKLGPVFITDRGQPSYVLLSIETYRALSNNYQSVAEAFASLEPTGEIEFPPVMTDAPRSATFD